MSEQGKEDVAGGAGGVLGATCGIGGSVAGVAAAGVSGLSAVGVTSGLAAIGGTMIGGVVVLTAGVAVVTFGGAWAARMLYRRWREGGSDGASVG